MIAAAAAAAVADLQVPLEPRLPTLLLLQHPFKVISSRLWGGGGGGQTAQLFF